MLQSLMGTKIGCSFSCSPSSRFQHNTYTKLRLSQFVNRQSVTNLTNYDKDISYGVPKLRARLHKLQTAFIVGSEDHSQIIFPISKSFFHLSGNDGKPGVVSFCNRPSSRDNEVISSNSERIRNSISLFTGPAVFVACFSFPLICLPAIFTRIFGNSSLSFFFQIFFREVIFYCGVAVFLFLLDRLMRPKQVANNSDPLTTQLRQEAFSAVTVFLRQLGITISMVTMGLYWPWTSHVVPATLAPYLAGIFAQFTFEMLTVRWKSPSLAAIPFIFHVYRLHQIHKAANMLTYLIAGKKLPDSLGGLPNTLQLLLMVWIWSFSIFLMRFLLLHLQLRSDANI